MIDVSKFIKDYTALCIGTLGFAIVGYIGYLSVCWIINKCHKTEKIDRLAQKSISQVPEINLPGAKNAHNMIQQNPLINMPDHNASINEAQGDDLSFKQKDLAATKIQTAFRKHLAIAALKKQQAVKHEEKKSTAAVKIQRIWRGHFSRVELAKTRKSLLSSALLDRAKLYVENPMARLNMPRASSGKTAVYLPHELPIVLKESGSPKNQQRLEQMKQAREICDQSGYDNLVIPRARVYRNFIIESRLPITMHKTKEQLGLYVENREQFTNAVKDFTGFLCQSKFDDITGNYGTDPYATLSQSPIGRYDNVAIYLEENQGKIGLVDLERFSPGCSKLNENWCFLRCMDAVRLFPYHLDEILSVAKNFDPKIENDREALIAERDEALKRFKIGYENHLSHIIDKGIEIADPTKFEHIKLSRKKEIQVLIEQEILKQHQHGPFKGCLGIEPDESMRRFMEKGFPQLIDKVCEFINTLLEMNLEKAGGKHVITSRVKLLSVRSLDFDLVNFLYNNPIEESIEMFAFDRSLPFFERHRESFVLHLLEVVLKELERGKEIAYYNPQFGFAGYARACIFC